MGCCTESYCGVTRSGTAIRPRIWRRRHIRLGNTGGCLDRSRSRTSPTERYGRGRAGPTLRARRHRHGSQRDHIRTCCRAAVALLLDDATRARCCLGGIRSLGSSGGVRHGGRLRGQTPWPHYEWSLPRSFGRQVSGHRCIGHPLVARKGVMGTSIADRRSGGCRFGIEIDRSTARGFDPGNPVWQGKDAHPDGRRGDVALPTSCAQARSGDDSSLGCGRIHPGIGHGLCLARSAGALEGQGRFTPTRLRNPR